MKTPALPKSRIGELLGFPGFTVVVLSVVLLAVAFGQVHSADQEAPFGTKADVDFAATLWKAMDGYGDWTFHTSFYPGQSPHGKVLRMYYNYIPVGDTLYHVIVKDNYRGENATVENVSKSPRKYLDSVTVMVSREAGHAKDDDDWYYAKYLPDGSLAKNPKGMSLAGRVAKGSDQGCIACHRKAHGGDFVFFND